MTVVSDSSPLIILSKLRCFDLLSTLYPRVYISEEVHREVVIEGANLPGAGEVAGSQWIEVKALRDRSEGSRSQQMYSLGAGELSTILLARQLNADEVLIDDLQARKLARDTGLRVRGTIGLLEKFYAKGVLADLHSTFQQLLVHGAYIDPKLLNRRLQIYGQPTL